MSPSALERTASSLVPERIVEQRTGSVLLKDTILKSDHFPGCHNTKLQPHLEGCPNYRQVDGLPVYGVAVPTARGLRVMLDKLAADLPTGTTVYWNNMREEPLIYINGRPFVVREQGNPFMNLQYTGITKERVEDMEDRLRQDILTEAAKYDHQILVADEDDAFNVFDMMLRVSEADVQTPKAMFEELQGDGYNVAYNRIPITDEKGPKPSDFDHLVRQVYTASQPPAFVFNCQMGRGRTTTGMVITSLVLLKLNSSLDRDLGDAAGSSDAPSAIGAAATDAGAPTATPLEAGAPPWFQEGLDRSLRSQTTAVCDRADATAMMRAGHLLVVRSLLRVLPHATHAKAALDAVVDACAAMQNLRSIIVRYRANMIKESREDKRAKILSVVADHIDRYCHLIVFCSYLCSGMGPGRSHHQPFAAFLGSYPEIQSVLDRLLWAFPLLTLELDGKSGKDKLSESEKTLEEISDILAQRHGAVLTASTILKADSYPSLHSNRLPQPFDGAPNFRQAEPDLPVFGAGISTLLGIQRVLQAVGSGPYATAAKAAEQRLTVWHNLREEPVLYINGTPYVLREAAGAYTNMKEYSSIDGDRLEQLEERLRAEVLQEAQQLGGKVQVLYEEMTNTGRGYVATHKRRGRLQSGFEVVLDATGVMTPRQLFESLAKAGYGVRYTRVPITDGKVPSHQDVVDIHASVAATPTNSNFIFNCQQGKGRTTIGMAMASLHLSAEVWRERRKFGIAAEARLRVSSLPSAKASQAVVDPGSPRLSPLATHVTSAPAVVTGDSSSSSLEGDSDVEASPSKPKSPPHTALGRAPQRTASPACGSAIRPVLPRRGSVPPFGAGPPAHPRHQCAFLGVRRLLGEIAESAVIVSWLDSALDACSHLVHLRDVVGSFRAGRQPSAQLMPEFSRLRQAFERDAVALARYCLLITYAAYLHHNADTKTAAAGEPQGARSFKDWVESLGSVKHALAASLEDPVRALTPLLQAVGPPSRATTPKAGGAVTDENPDGSVPAAKVTQVLTSRRFRMLSPTTILKSFHQPDAFSATDAASGRDIPGLSDLYQIRGQPIWLASNPSVTGLRGLVECLGGKNGSRVVVLDTREELGVYLRGHPYTRRELEMPTASMHHAGIHWRELRKLELWFRDDVCSSSSEWADDAVYRVLVHKEAPAPDGAAGPLYSIEDATDVTLQQSTATHLTAHWVHVHAEEVDSVDCGITTAWQVIKQLRTEGHRVWYRRLPLSRNRTPDASDMANLHACAFAAASPPDGDAGGAGPGVGKDVKFVLVARAAATSTSTSFVAHFLGLVLAALEAFSSRAGSAGGDGPRKAARTDAAPPSASLNLSVLDNLCRVLDNGRQCREDVDAAVNQLHSIQAASVCDVKDSIAACKSKVEQIQAHRTSDAAGTFRKQQELSAAKRLGAHYLKRYFLLIAFRAYFEEWLQARGQGEEQDLGSFSEWFRARKELGHLLRSCKI